MTSAPPSRPNLDLSFAVDQAGVTRLKRRYARYPWSLTRPFWIDKAPKGMASVIPQSTSGPLLPGDRVTQRISLETGASAHITSQGAQVVHGVKDAAEAASHWQISLAAGSLLELILDPVVLFPNSHLDQRFQITLEEGACLILSDGVTWHPDLGDPQFHCFASTLELLDPAGIVRVRERSWHYAAALRALTATAERPVQALGQVWILFGEGEHREIDLPAPHNSALYAGTSRLPNDAGHLCRFLVYETAAFAPTQQTLWQGLREARFGSRPAVRRKGS